jgi:hypothetical protein
MESYRQPRSLKLAQTAYIKVLRILDTFLPAHIISINSKTAAQQQSTTTAKSEIGRVIEIRNNGVCAILKETQRR